MISSNDEELYIRFSDEEFHRRHKLLREALETLDLDCVVLAGSPGYMSGGYGAFWVSGYPERIGIVSYVIFPRSGTPTLIIPFAGSHVRSAKRISFIQDIRHSQHGNYVEVIADRINQLGLGSKKIGITELDARYGIGIPYDVYAGLQSRFPKASFQMIRG